MQMTVAEYLRKKWGDKPCGHPGFSKEYHLGSHTGDYVCTQCGEAFSSQEKEQIEARRPIPRSQ